MVEARSLLSQGRDSLAYRSLQDRIEDELPTPEEEELLDSLREVFRKRAVAGARMDWTVSMDGQWHPGEHPPAGIVEAARPLPAEALRGASVRAGILLGAWPDDGWIHPDLEGFAEIANRDTDDFRSARAWLGATPEGEFEVGVSSDWLFSTGSGDLPVRQGPFLQASRYHPRWFGWRVLAGGEGWRWSGALRWRQEPEWTHLADSSSGGASLAQSSLQATLRLEGTSTRVLSVVPVLGVDGRVFLIPDHWSPHADRRSTSYRQGVQADAGARLGWSPSRPLRVALELGWSLVTESGGAPVELLPFDRGPYLRLSVSGRV